MKAYGRVDFDIAPHLLTSALVGGELSRLGNMTKYEVVNPRAAQHNGSNWTSQRYRTITSKRGGITARISEDSKSTPIFLFNRRGTTTQPIMFQDLKY
jgi:hypothetical protein